MHSALPLPKPLDVPIERESHDHQEQGSRHPVNNSGRCNRFAQRHEPCEEPNEHRRYAGAHQPSGAVHGAADHAADVRRNYIEG